MARGNKRASEQSTLGAGSTVNGNISGEGDLDVQGRIAGNVNVQGAVSIASGGVIDGDVNAASVSIAGVLTGDADCGGEIAVLRSAQVRGVLKGSRVSIEPGAKVSVRLDTEFDLDV